MNPYESPKTTGTPRQISVTREQILKGETSAGPLAILAVKYPKTFFVTSALVIGGICGYLIMMIIDHH